MCGKDFKYFDQFDPGIRQIKFDPGIRQIKFVCMWENRLIENESLKGKR